MMETKDKVINDCILEIKRNLFTLADILNAKEFINTVQSLLDDYDLDVFEVPLVVSEEDEKVVSEKISVEIDGDTGEALYKSKEEWTPCIGLKVVDELSGKEYEITRDLFSDGSIFVLSRDDVEGTWDKEMLLSQCKPVGFSSSIKEKLTESINEDGTIKASSLKELNNNEQELKKDQEVVKDVADQSLDEDKNLVDNIIYSMEYFKNRLTTDPFGSQHIFNEAMVDSILALANYVKNMEQRLKSDMDVITDYSPNKIT